MSCMVFRFRHKIDIPCQVQCLHQYWCSWTHYQNLKIHLLCTILLSSHFVFDHYMLSETRSHLSSSSSSCTSMFMFNWHFVKCGDNYLVTYDEYFLFWLVACVDIILCVLHSITLHILVVSYFCINEINNLTKHVVMMQLMCDSLNIIISKNMIILGWSVFFFFSIYVPLFLLAFNRTFI